MHTYVYRHVHTHSHIGMRVRAHTHTLPQSATPKLGQALQPERGQTEQMEWCGGSTDRVPEEEDLEETPERVLSEWKGGGLERRQVLSAGSPGVTQKQAGLSSPAQLSGCSGRWS